jgi:hypothetical protein
MKNEVVKLKGLLTSETKDEVIWRDEEFAAKSVNSISSWLRNVVWWQLIAPTFTASEESVNSEQQHGNLRIGSNVITEYCI